MASFEVHGFVQACTKKSEMSKSKEALIKIVEEKTVQLVVSFSTGENETFLLSNNIKNVIRRSYGENQNFLCLTFQNNNFMFVEGLTNGDADKLNTFLDTICENQLKPSPSSGRGKEVLSSAPPGKKTNKKLVRKASKKLSSGFSGLEEGSETPALQDKPLLSEPSEQKSQESLEHPDRKRKRRIHLGSEMNKKLRVNQYSAKAKKFKRNTMKQRRKMVRKETKSENTKEVESSSIKSLESPCLGDVGIFRSLFEKMYLAFILKPKISGEVKFKWQRLLITLDYYPEKAWQGLPNLGNTCYMNAVLQSLFSIPSFVDDFLYQDFPRGQILLDIVSLRMAQLLVLKEIYNNPIKRKLLANIKDAISAVAAIFSGNVQNDAHEFLGHCLDLMKESMGRIKVIMKAKSKSEAEGLDQQALPGSAALKIPICPVVANFEFELLRSISCKACDHVIYKAELNNYLSMNLPERSKAQPLSIQSILDLFLGAEDLEYTCENCKHKHSLGVHKFSRLPRVLIIHLKRYNFTEYWSLKKDKREVVMPTYLNVSSHCNESTEDPLPLSKYTRTQNKQVLNIFQMINFDANLLGIFWKRLSSKLMATRASPNKSNNQSELAENLVVSKSSSIEKQPENLEKVSRPSELESTSTNTNEEANIKEELLVTNAMTGCKDTPCPLMFEDEGISNSIPDTDLADVPENAKSKKYLEDDRSLELSFECVEESPEEFYDDIILQNTEENQQRERMRVYENAPQETLHTEELEKPIQFNFQEAGMSSQDDSLCNPSPAKDILKSEKIEMKAEKQKGNAVMRDPHTYRLIGIISHLGNSINSGHYISDAYDFERQVWFTYNDLQVSSINEIPMQGARLCTGYIFFYMHNEIFKELVQREGNSSNGSSERNPPQQQGE
ncbi:ubiquitin carboxyl-terminal hydrolase 26 [Suncus etruscus]|uniref:ubiquitin carboxyl-terminal hydrolase 26 n=1 Tax=Suncus etruscus TaxID=109475 RepID=UPI00210F96A8|nr:ubiquitin carboxyl-terminal hydrolase 26 [Suncus etruscus]